jgi:hypothetical protein
LDIDLHCGRVHLRPYDQKNGESKMKYLHTLDPDDIRDMEQQREMDYFATVAELEAEDRAMERYYEEKYK